MSNRKGLILAGGSGTRLYPITRSLSKQLLPIYDKPMIYYPLSVLMLCGIREIAIITTSQDQCQFKEALGDGNQWGIAITYIVQPNPDGLAQAYILAEDFLNGDSSALILGDNLFFGHGLHALISAADEDVDTATVFSYRVSDPERYGVVSFDENGHVQNVVEKPDVAPSNYAITGLYFCDNTASSRAKKITRSSRGEYEIVSLLESYLRDDLLSVRTMGRGFAWLDTGTHDSLLDAGNYVRTLTKRQGMLIGSPDEVAFRLGLINSEDLYRQVALYSKNEYGQNLQRLADEE